MGKRNIVHTDILIIPFHTVKGLSALLSLYHLVRCNADGIDLISRCKYTGTVRPVHTGYIVIIIVTSLHKMRHDRMVIVPRIERVIGTFCHNHTIVRKIGKRIPAVRIGANYDTIIVGRINTILERDAVTERGNCSHRIIFCISDNCPGIALDFLSPYRQYRKQTQHPCTEKQFHHFMNPSTRHPFSSVLPASYSFCPAMPPVSHIFPFMARSYGFFKFSNFF